MFISEGKLLHYKTLRATWCHISTKLSDKCVKTNCLISNSALTRSDGLVMEAMNRSNSRDDDQTWLVKTSFLVRLTEIGNLSETCFSKIKRYFKWDGITINKTTLLLTSEFRQKKVICVLKSGRTEFLYWKQQRRKKKRFRELAIWWCQQLEKNVF